MTNQKQQETAAEFDLDAFVSAYMAQQNRSGQNCDRCFKEGYNKGREQMAKEILLPFLTSAKITSSNMTFYLAISNSEAQICIFKCHFCEGEFISSYPNWEEPTDVNFPHRKGCIWLPVVQEFKRLSE